MPNTANTFLKLIAIMDELREKCPWDKKQTIASLRSMTIEETYELANAIDNNNFDEIKEELGDLMLHIVFYCKIASEKNAFTIADVLEGINKKLIDRHPHVYGNVVVDNEDDVKKNWEQIKIKEGKKSVLSGVPKAMPALNKAITIQEKVKKIGFDWDDKKDVWNKVEEEIAELKEAENCKTKADIEEEFGDVLFSLINYARFIDIDPEVALEKVNKKFINRFSKMENFAANDNKNLLEMSLQEMDTLWNKAKKTEK
jgi:MazG family protein